MSQVRGTDSAVTVTDLPRSGGLSGVRPNNPDRKSQEVLSPPEKVAKRNVTAVEMTLDEKVSVLNALRSIRSKIPKVKDPKVQSLIDMLYVKWVDETMLEILSPNLQIRSQFNPQEIEALKVLAQTILQRQHGSAGQPAPAPMVPRTGANPNPPTEALNPGPVDDVKFRQAQEGFLRELSKMEREGPSF
jgi:hypothetical protein